MMQIRVLAAAAAAFLLLVVSPAPGQQSPAPQPQQQGKTSADTYRQLNLFGEVFERVRADYVEEVTDEQLVESAINGMLSSL